MRAGPASAPSDDMLSPALASMGLTPLSEGWVGAWWLGFFVAAFITWLAALPVLGFPRVMPESRDLDAGDSETHGGRDAQQLEKLENKLAEGRVKVRTTKAGRRHRQSWAGPRYDVIR